MIYDCFPFFNELDLLEIRLHELSKVVDNFVLVESTRTFQNNPKPLYYELNKDRFKEFENKITHIVVDRFPGFFYKFRKPGPWDYSNFQKNKVSEGLINCKPEDIILISDLDEIPSSERILELINKQGTFIFQQLFCNFYLNFAAVDAPMELCLTKHNQHIYWKGTVMLRYKNFINFKKSRLMRDKDDNSVQQVIEGGWHFSFLGDYSQIIKKLKAWEHSKEMAHWIDEYISDPSKLNGIIEKGGDLFGGMHRFEKVSPSQFLPAYINGNLDKFSHLLIK